MIEVARECGYPSVWCVAKMIELRVKKCSVTLFRGKQKILSSYRAGPDVLSIKRTIKDLGVRLDENLTFNEHISRRTVGEPFSVLTREELASSMTRTKRRH